MIERWASDNPSQPGARIGPVPAPPPLEPGGIPLAILVDYDGTVATTDVSDTVMAEFAAGLDWVELNARYDEGELGSRDLMAYEVSLVRENPARLYALAAEQPHDKGFVPFVARARAAGVPVEVVSDGFGFFIPAALDALGVGDLPIATARTTFGPDGGRIEFPNGHPDCLVCGTCKRARVLAHQAAGRTVVFIGDGESDRYAAGYSDLVFAKRSLIGICEEHGWAYRTWGTFADLDRWLAAAIRDWRTNAFVLPAPTARAFFCGPEVWGPGLRNPPGLPTGER